MLALGMPVQPVARQSTGCQSRKVEKGGCALRSSPQGNGMGQSGWISTHRMDGWETIGEQGAPALRLKGKQNHSE